MSDLLTNAELFRTELEKAYTALFKTEDYQFTASRQTPAGLARIMVDSLLAGSANKEGEGIRMACKALGVGYTYKAIDLYLKG